MCLQGNDLHEQALGEQRGRGGRAVGVGGGAQNKDHLSCDYFSK